MGLRLNKPLPLFLDFRITTKNIIMKTYTEYSIVGGKFDEHYEELEGAKQSFNALSKSDKRKVQFFQKDYEQREDNEWVETYVEIFSNYSDEKIKYSDE